MVKNLDDRGQMSQLASGMFALVAFYVVAKFLEVLQAPYQNEIAAIFAVLVFLVGLGFSSR